jgi:cytochrome c-type biogenesis protein CcmH
MPSTPTTPTKTLPPAAEETLSPLQRPSRALVVSILLFVFAFGLLGYAWRGNRAGLAVGPGEGMATSEVTPQQIAQMVGKLEQKLKAQPNDAEGWAMLARTYSVLERYPEALAAYRKVVTLKPDDAQALVDLADGMAMANNRTLEGEPERLIAQALERDPKNIKALALAGTVAFNRNDFAAAADLWQRAIDNAEPGSEFVRQMAGAVSEARQRAGAPRPPAAAASAVIAGRVTLAPALAAQVQPGDTLFVFARAAGGQGPKMPLAILRRTAGDLPLEFNLDDSLAMSPAARLSSSSQVIIGARISKSGNPMAQPGDLQVFSAPVPLGTTGLRLEIGEPVR